LLGGLLGSSAGSQSNGDLTDRGGRSGEHSGVRPSAVEQARRDFEASKSEPGPGWTAYIEEPDE